MQVSCVLKSILLAHSFHSFDWVQALVVLLARCRTISTHAQKKQRCKKSSFVHVGIITSYVMSDVIEIENHVISLSKENVEINPEINASCCMTYDEFFTKFLAANRPCVFNSDITSGWRCRREWNANGAPNFESIDEMFGDCEAPVADCKRRYYNSQFCDDMTISKYLNYWKEFRAKNYTEEMPLYYLKDWHCVKNYSNLSLYEVPKFLASDWLNEFYMAHPELEDDYMFVYMGPKGTWTPFHADVFTSYSWSANIVGKKRWLLFPPGEENRLRDSYGQLIFDATSDELQNSSKYPNYNEQELKRFEIIQEAGQIIFVPSGWHHQVWNLEDTISVNHNWINGCNIRNVWLALKKELLAVLREVEDCRDMEDWEKHCQLMLKASHGMDYAQFYKFLSFIINRRLNTLKKCEVFRSFDTWKIGTNHSLFDINQARIVLTNLIEDTKDKHIYEIIFPDDKVQDLLAEINVILSSI